MYKGGHKCEPYVKVLFENHETFRTSTFDDWFKPESPNFYFYQLFQSDKTLNSTNIKIGIWDLDSRNDDLVLKEETTPTLLSGARKFSNGENSLSVVGYNVNMKMTDRFHHLNSRSILQTRK